MTLLKINNNCKNVYKTQRRYPHADAVFNYMLKHGPDAVKYASKTAAEIAKKSASKTPAEIPATKLQRAVMLKFNERLYGGLCRGGPKMEELWSTQGDYVKRVELANGKTDFVNTEYGESLVDEDLKTEGGQNTANRLIGVELIKNTPEIINAALIEASTTWQDIIKTYPNLQAAILAGVCIVGAAIYCDNLPDTFTADPSILLDNIAPGTSAELTPGEFPAQIVEQLKSGQNTIEDVREALDNWDFMFHYTQELLKKHPEEIEKMYNLELTPEQLSSPVRRDISTLKDKLAKEIWAKLNNGEGSSNIGNLENSFQGVDENPLKKLELGEPSDLDKKTPDLSKKQMGKLSKLPEIKDFSDRSTD